MKLRLHLGIVAGFFLATVFSTPVFAWPFGDKKKAEAQVPAAATPTSRKVQPPAPPSASVLRNENNSPQEDDFFEDDSSESTEVNEENETSELPLVPQLPKIPKANVSTVPSLPPTKYPDLSKNSVPMKSSDVPGLDPDILRIQKQIQEIMKINESLKTNFSGQAAEIQKISDQAKIHGQILKDLDSNKKITEEASAERYLNKEKLRLIREETDKNQKYLQELNHPKDTSVSENSESLPLISAESNKNV